MEMEREIDGRILNVPEHVAIILDGNGRWAKKRFMPRNYGHAQGSKNVEKMCEVAPKRSQYVNEAAQGLSDRLY